MRGLCGKDISSSGATPARFGLPRRVSRINPYTASAYTVVRLRIRTVTVRDCKLANWPRYGYGAVLTVPYKPYAYGRCASLGG